MDVLRWGGSVIAALSVLVLAAYGHVQKEPAAEKEAQQQQETHHVLGCPMVGYQLRATDLQVVLAHKEELELTDEQVTKLEAIAEKARREAESVLTEEQRGKTQTIAKAAGMHETCWGMMSTAAGEHMKVATMMCPMMAEDETPPSSKMPESGAKKMRGAMGCPMMGM